LIQGSLVPDFGYAGMYYHAPSGLNLTLYRAYDSDLGRWLNRDPIQEAGGLNLYAYVHNNPVNEIDPLGLYNPISGPSGAVGPGSGLADPSLFLPPQLQPPNNTSPSSGCPPGSPLGSPVDDAMLEQDLSDVYNTLPFMWNPFWDPLDNGDTDTPFYYDKAAYNANWTYNGTQFPELDGTTMTGHELNYIGTGYAMAAYGFPQSLATGLTQAWMGNNQAMNQNNALTAMHAGYNYFNSNSPTPQGWNIDNQGNPSSGFYP
jgi:RHS repeat-associated protein